MKHLHTGDGCETDFYEPAAVHVLGAFARRGNARAVEAMRDYSRTAREAECDRNTQPDATAAREDCGDAVRARGV